MAGPIQCACVRLCLNSGEREVECSEEGSERH